jgi:hypothetical protein
MKPLLLRLHPLNGLSRVLKGPGEATPSCNSALLLSVSSEGACSDVSFTLVGGRKMSALAIQGPTCRSIDRGHLRSNRHSRVSESIPLLREVV